MSVTTNKAKKTSRAHGKKWLVQKSSKRDFEGIGGRGRWYEFGKKTGSFVTSDDSFVDEAHQRYGWAKGGSRDVIITEIDDPLSRTTKSLWSVPALPWHEED